MRPCSGRTALLILHPAHGIVLWMVLPGLAPSALHRKAVLRIEAAHPITPTAMAPMPGSWLPLERRSLEVLTKHLRSVHPSGSPELDKQKSTIYDPWPLVDEILCGTTRADVARAYAISAVKERAVELGKSRIWRDSWGRRGKRPDNLDVM
ncbi:hypothetical protein BC826DRAFT_683593 [Russula brevipes]|nr:hypothetical protein BC826DRAFT_683593 [Russula brevipes]